MSDGKNAPQTITKKQIVDTIAERGGHTRTVVKAVIQEFLDEVTEQLTAGNRLEFRDFGVFEVRERAARVAQNPKTLEKVDVPPRRSVKFKPGRKMAEQVQDAAGTDRPAGAPERDERNFPEIEVKSQGRSRVS